MRGRRSARLLPSNDSISVNVNLNSYEGKLTLGPDLGPDAKVSDDDCLVLQDDRLRERGVRPAICAWSTRGANRDTCQFATW